MPLIHFVALLGFVVLAAGLTLLLAFVLEVPLIALALAALSGSLILGLRSWA